MSDYYDYDGLPITEDQWLVMFKNRDPQGVGRDIIMVDDLEVTVSTVWLGTDHNFGGSGPPLIFETMILGLPGDAEPMWRYTTQDEAIEGHRRAVNCLRDPLGRFTILP